MAVYGTAKSANPQLANTLNRLSFGGKYAGSVGGINSGVQGSSAPAPTYYHYTRTEAPDTPQAYTPRKPSPTPATPPQQPYPSSQSGDAQAAPATGGAQVLEGLQQAAPPGGGGMMMGDAGPEPTPGMGIGTIGTRPGLGRRTYPMETALQGLQRAY